MPSRLHCCLHIQYTASSLLLVVYAEGQATCAPINVMHKQRVNILGQATGTETGRQTGKQGRRQAGSPATKYPVHREEEGGGGKIGRMEY